MNKKLLALSLVAMPCLIAQDSYKNNSSNKKTTGQQANYCTSQPKQCIDCECYTPAFYNLQCDCGFFIDVAFLYWYACETNLSYAAKLQVKNTGSTSASIVSFFSALQSIEFLDVSWNPGVRVGIGMNSKCDGWDYYLNWTYFCNKEKESISVPDYAFFSTSGTDVDPFLAEEGESFLTNPWTNFTIVLIDDNETSCPTFDKIAAKWHFTLNSIDLELGRKYWLSHCFNLRPFAGIRGAWTRIKFDTTSTRNAEADASGTVTRVNVSFNDQFNTDNWGVGLLGGLQPNWYFCENFLLYGNFDLALIWGKFKIKKAESYFEENQTGTGPVETRISFNNNLMSKFFSNECYFRFSSWLALGRDLVLQSISHHS